MHTMWWWGGLFLHLYIDIYKFQLSHSNRAFREFKTHYTSNGLWKCFLAFPTPTSNHCINESVVCVIWVSNWYPGIYIKKSPHHFFFFLIVYYEYPPTTTTTTQRCSSKFLIYMDTNTQECRHNIGELR